MSRRVACGDALLWLGGAALFRSSLGPRGLRTARMWGTGSFAGGAGAGGVAYAKAGGDEKYVDVEGGQSRYLYPGVSECENAVRWGFIRKVYGILSAQLLLTTLVASWFTLSETAQATVATSPFLRFVMMFGPLLWLWPLYLYRQKHPHNLAWLAVWTATISLSVGAACSQVEGVVVVQALVLTACIAFGLTAYTFYAVRKGEDFGFMGPSLCSGLWLLIGFSFLSIFFPFSDGYRLMMAVGGAALFAGFLVYDTNELIKRHSIDEYVWASVELYLDLINLFLELMRILTAGRNDN